MNLCSHSITFQIDLEKNKAREISKLQAALREMEQRVEEAIEMQERELAKKAIEEALAQEREKITVLTNEIDELKVLFFLNQLMKYPNCRYLQGFQYCIVNLIKSDTVIAFVSR